MILTKFLNESYDRNQILNILKSECIDFINEIKSSNRFLYRGMSDYRILGLIEKKIPRTDREPSHTSIKYHKVFDELFNKKFGWKPRSQGVFTSPSKTTALSYGNTYLFFPIGSYQYIWSFLVKDLYADLVYSIEGVERYNTLANYAKNAFKNTLSLLLKIPNEDASNLINTKPIEEIVQLLIDEVMDSYSKNYLLKAIKTNSEIMFKCSSYYVIDLSLEDFLLKELF